MNTELSIMQGFSELSPVAQARVIAYLASVYEETARQPQRAAPQRQPQPQRAAPQQDDDDGARELAKTFAPDQRGGQPNAAPFPLPSDARLDRNGR